MMQGPLDRPENQKLVDLNGREIACLLPLVALMFWIGIAPNWYLGMIDQAVYNTVVAPVEQVRGPLPPPPAMAPPPPPARTGHGPDDGHGHPGADVLDEVEAGLAVEPVERLGAQLPDLRLEGGDPLGGERPRQQAAVDGVGRRVLEDEDPGRHLDAGLDELQDPAPAGDERGVVLQPPLDVLVAADGPEVVLVAAVERCLVTEAPKGRVGVGEDLGVPGVPLHLAALRLIDGHHGLPPNPGSGISSLSELSRRWRSAPGTGCRRPPTPRACSAPHAVRLRCSPRGARY